MSTGHRLMDSGTAEDLGPATDAQAEASNRSEDAGQNGHFLIDADGDVLAAGTWDARQLGVRAVYTQPGGAA